MASLEWMKQALLKHPWVSREEMSDPLVIKLYGFIFQGRPFLPETAQEWYLLGHYYNEKRTENQEVIPPCVQEAYQQALACGEGRAAEALGNVYEFTDIPLAISYWQQAVASGHYSAYISLAYRADNIEAAVKYFRLAIDHQVPYAYSQLVNYYDDEDMTDEIMTTLHEGVAAGHHDLLEELVKRYLKMDQVDQAKIYAELQVERQPNFRPGYVQLAACLTNQEEQVELWKKAQTPPALLSLFQYYEGRDKAQYIHYLDQYCRQCPHDRAAINDASRYYQKYPSPAGLLFHVRIGRFQLLKTYLNLLAAADLTAEFHHVLLQVDLPEEIPPVYQALKKSYSREIMLQLRLDPTYFRHLPLDIINLIMTEF